MNRDVIIAGAGVAGCTAAIALLRHGLRPVLLRVRTAPAIPGIEAIPPKAVPFQEILGWEKVLAAAGAVCADGFENGLGSGPPFIHAGCYWHVERTRLASAALHFAVAAGAELIEIDRPTPAPTVTEGSNVIIGGRTFVAAIDATGRSAAWMGGRTRYGREIADCYVAYEAYKQSSNIARGAIAHLSGGWAYRIGLLGATTIGIVQTGTNANPVNQAQGDEILGTEVAARWGVVGRTLTKVARRPAFAQSATVPVIANRLFAVGDAAFAPNPISGQGILFALASALAVGASIDTVLRDSSPEVGVRYYHEFVQASIRRHVTFSQELLTAQIHVSAASETVLWPGDREVVCSVPMIQHSVKAFDRVITGPVLVLPSGQLTRWYGEIDLLVIAAAARKPVSWNDLESHLCRCGWHTRNVRQSLAWCLREGLLRDRA